MACEGYEKKGRRMKNFPTFYSINFIRTFYENINFDMTFMQIIHIFIFVALSFVQKFH